MNWPITYMHYAFTSRTWASESVGLGLSCDLGKSPNGSELLFPYL